MSALLQELRTLEAELHARDTRRNAARLDELLHPEFEEFGRSGRRYSRDEVLSDLTANTSHSRVVTTDFQVAELGDGVALLTYLSAHRTESGELRRRTLRASLWLRTPEGRWRMRFHQGTPVYAAP